MRVGNVCLCVFGWAWAAWADPAGFAETIRQGAALQSQGRFAEAAARFQAALHDAEQAPGDFVSQAAALDHLSSLHADMGRFEDAATFCVRAISILRKVAGDDDTRLQNLRIELAQVYTEGGQPDTARRLLEQVVRIQSKAGQADEAAARGQDALACLYAEQRKLKPAEAHERVALAILAGLRSKDPVLQAAFNIHMALIIGMRESRAAEALPFAETAATLLARLPHEVFLNAETQLALGSLYASLGRPDDAERASRRGVEMIVQVFGPDHIRTGWALLAEGAILRRAKRGGAEAKELRRRGERIVTEQNHRDGLRDTVPVSALLPTR